MAPRRTLGSRFARVLGIGFAAGFAALAYTWLSLPDVRELRRTNPTNTAFMRLRAREAHVLGERPRQAHRWVSYNRISPALAKAVRVAEDAAFWDHDGIDLGEIKASIQDNWTKGTPLRGASTITQQLAKNLYLSPARNPYRKVTELLITRRLEAELSKTRIMELYLNLIEWGDGIWGAEAAAQAYFGVHASELSNEQAALLAAAIANPRTYNPAHPSAGLLKRQQKILGRMGISG
jgi:monofunctional biosynthetic peptidoglycan transglycosylase